ncbi:MAG: hypothetical protein AB8H79_20440 [Myxococcota bacterium]
MLTAIPVGVGAWWLFLLLCMLWRRTVWQRAGASIRELADGSGGVQPLWFGYAVQRGQNTVSWFGGLRGARTTVRRGDGQVLSHEGWLEPEEVLAQLNG